MPNVSQSPKSSHHNTGPSAEVLFRPGASIDYADGNQDWAHKDHTNAKSFSEPDTASKVDNIDADAAKATLASSVSDPTLPTGTSQDDAYQTNGNATGTHGFESVANSQSVGFTNLDHSVWYNPEAFNVDSEAHQKHPLTHDTSVNAAGQLDNFENSLFNQYVYAVPDTPAEQANQGIDIDAQVQPNEDNRNPPFLRPALKRSLDSGQAHEGPTSASSDVTDLNAKRTRRVSFQAMSSTAPMSAADDDSSASDNGRETIQLKTTNAPLQHRAPYMPQPSSRTTTSQPNQRPTSTVQTKGNTDPSSHSAPLLPAEKVFPIQVGSEQFRLSGASISSDAPSYFTQFFETQLRQIEESGGVRPLNIDRDPETFRDIARHLQGYYVKPRDGAHFVKLFADAQFYNLPRLISQLFESEIYIQIGGQHFQISKDLFSDAGNSPNFFSLGFSVFFSTPGEIFPGLDRRGLLRPPSITPPSVPGRSAEVFAQLLHALRGYPVDIKNEAHRAELLRDCRYYNLRGLEQRLIAHDISYNLSRKKMEICLRIEDIKPSGISYLADENCQPDKLTGGWVRYQRPFTDDESHELIVEFGNECMALDLKDMRMELFGLTRARVTSLLQVIANKMNLPTTAPFGAMMLSNGRVAASASPGSTALSENRVKVQFEPSTSIVVDGEPLEPGTLRELQSTATSQQSQDTEEMDLDKTRSRPGSGARPGRNQSAGSPPSPLRRRQTLPSTEDEIPLVWTLQAAQFRLRVQPKEVPQKRGGYEAVFIGVKISAMTKEITRNTRRQFLNSR